MAKLILVMGCSAVGKTTFAKQYAKDNNYLYLAPDSFYELINGDDKIRTHRFTVWITLFQAINAAMEANRDVVIDTNALRINDRDQFLGWFPNFEHHLIYIDAPWEVRKTNNQNRDRHIPEDILKQMEDIVEPPHWNGLDRRWKTFIHIRNTDNRYQIIESRGKLDE